MSNPHESRQEFASTFNREVNPLEKYENEFKRMDSDPFDLFKTEVVVEKEKENTRNNYLVPIRQWREFMTDRDRHPACPGDRHVEAFVEYQLEDQENGKDGTKQKLIHLNRVFKFWVGEKALPHEASHNPFKKVIEDTDWESENSKKPPNLSIDEVGDVLSQINHWRHYAIILMQLFFGARAQELCNIELCEINIQHEGLKECYPELGTHDRVPEGVNAVYIPTQFDREGNKSMEERVMPIPDELRVALVRYLTVRPDNGKPWLFLSQTRHNQMGNSKINEIWKEYFHPQYQYDEDAKFASITSHFGRHYFTTWLKKEQGWQRELLKYVRGDSIKGKDGDSLDDYVHSYFDDIHQQYLEEIYKFGLR